MGLKYLRAKHLVALKETNEKEQADAFVAYLKKENIVTNEDAIVKTIAPPHRTRLGRMAGAFNAYHITGADINVALIATT